MTATELRTAAAKTIYHRPYTLLTDPERCENCRYLKVVCDGNADRRCKNIISATLYAFDRSGAVRKLPLSQSGLRRKCGPPLRLTKGCVRGIIIVKTMA